MATLLGYADVTAVKNKLDEVDNKATAAQGEKADTAVQPDSYASSTVGGTLKARLDGTTLYLRNDGTNA